MKKILAMAVLGALAFGVAQADSVMTPDFLVPVAQCRDTSGLPSGLSITVTQNADGSTVANLGNRQDIGPFIDLGEIPVTLQPVKPGVDGAGMTYVGKDFQLQINTDSPESNGSFFSSIYADVQGRVFNEDMYCTLPVQAQQ